MESKISSLAILHEPFVAGMDENLSPIMQRLWKLEGGAIYFCRSGWAHVTIDLKDYEIVENTQIVLLPGTIIRINENRFRNQIAKNHLQSFMLDIYDKCYRYFDRQEIEGGSRQDEIFKNFIALVHENCISQREVTFYASKLCISTKYLTGICKSVTGEAAKKIIDDFAILEIKVLLQSTGLTIQEIADRLGFPDQSYLGRYFKRHEGMSPKEYQSKYSI